MSEFRLTGMKEVQAEMERAQKYLVGIPRGAERAMMHAFNRAAITGRKAGADATNALYHIGKNRVKKTFKTIRANTKNLEATIESRDGSIALHQFPHSPKNKTTRKGKRVHVSVMRGIEKQVGGNSFVRGGMILMRVGKTRYPLKLLYGVPIPEMMNNPKIVDAVQDAQMEMAVKRLDHEVTRMLAGYEGEKKW